MYISAQVESVRAGVCVGHGDSLVQCQQLSMSQVSFFDVTPAGHGREHDPLDPRRMDGDRYVCVCMTLFVPACDKSITHVKLCSVNLEMVQQLSVCACMIAAMSSNN